MKGNVRGSTGSIEHRPSSWSNHVVWSLFRVILMLSFCTSAGWTAGADPCDGLSQAKIDSWEMPVEVCGDTNFGSDRERFNQFSWRSFIALVWPAKMGSEGKPDPLQALTPANDQTRRVFEDFKPSWMLFQTDGGAIMGNNRAEGSSPCSRVVDRVSPYIVSPTKFGEAIQADDKGKGGPLIAQNRTFIRYAAGFNELLADDIGHKSAASTSGYLQSYTAPVGSITIKTAWMETGNLPDLGKSSYFVRLAWVRNADGISCRPAYVGLVAMHIVSKTGLRPQWIWSTFQHVRNQARSGDDCPVVGPYALNSEDGKAMLPLNPYSIADLAGAVPNPVNVDMLSGIEVATRELNCRFRSALHRAGSVWQNYELVMTQWPLHTNRPDLGGETVHTVPGVEHLDGVKQLPKSAVSNPAMETYLQTEIGSGCMGCHDGARYGGDYLWSVQLQGLGRGRVMSSTEMVALRRLRAMLGLTDR